MVLELFQKLVPWFIAIAILFFVGLIINNKNRLYKIRHSGRISEMIDRRRNIVFYSIVIFFLIVGLLFDIFF